MVKSHAEVDKTRCSGTGHGVGLCHVCGVQRANPVPEPNLCVRLVVFVDRAHLIDYNDHFFNNAMIECRVFRWFER